MRIKSIFGVALIALAISGCSSNGSKKTQMQQVVFSNADPAVQELNDSAVRIARAAEQATLALSVGGKGHSTKAPSTTREFKIDLERLPTELREPILLEHGFHGELEAFVRSLADVMSWTTVVVGNKPVVPILVSLSEQRRPPAEFLADAGYQAGGQADVVLNPSIRQVVVKYKN